MEKRKLDDEEAYHFMRRQAMISAWWQLLLLTPMTFSASVFSFIPPAQLRGNGAV